MLRSLLVSLRAFAAAAIVAITGLLLVTSLPLAAAKVRHFYPWDLVVDWNGAQSWIEGENIYEPENIQKRGLGVLGGIGHPPTTFIWFLPFAGIDLLEARDSLAMLVLFLVTVHVFVVMFELRVPHTFMVGSLVVAWVFSTRWFHDHLFLGQVSELIAFAYVGAWVLLRRGREVSSGVVLGLATTLKLFPAVLVVFLLVTRRWRGFVAACLTYVGVAAVMTARFGWSSWVLFFTQQSEIAHRWIGSGRNASLQGIVHRLFDSHCDGHTFDPTVGWIAAAAAVLFLVAGLTFVVKVGSCRQEFDLSFALVSIISFFANVWVWEHYYVLMILPLGVVAERLWRDSSPSRRQRVAGGVALAVCVALMTFNNPRSQDPSRVSVAMKTTWGHVALHLDEIGRWLPFVLTLAVLAALTVRRRGRDEVHEGPLPRAG